jgi:hypothetical protein
MIQRFPTLYSWRAWTKMQFDERRAPKQKEARKRRIVMVLIDFSSSTLFVVEILKEGRKENNVKTDRSVPVRSKKGNAAQTN